MQTMQQGARHGGELRDPERRDLREENEMDAQYTPRIRFREGTIEYGPARLVWGTVDGEIRIPLPGGAEVTPEELIRMARREGYAIVWPAGLR